MATHGNSTSITWSFSHSAQDEQLVVQVSAEDVEERMNALEENIKNLKPNLNAIEVEHPTKMMGLTSGSWGIMEIETWIDNRYVFDTFFMR